MSYPELWIGGDSAAGDVESIGRSIEQKKHQGYELGKDHDLMRDVYYGDQSRMHIASISREATRGLRTRRDSEDLSRFQGEDLGNLVDRYSDDKKEFLSASRMAEKQAKGRKKVETQIDAQLQLRRDNLNVLSEYQSNYSAQKKAFNELVAFKENARGNSDLLSHAESQIALVRDNMMRIETGCSAVNNDLKTIEGNIKTLRKEKYRKEALFECYEAKRLLGQNIVALRFERLELREIELRARKSKSPLPGGHESRKQENERKKNHFVALRGEVDEIIERYRPSKQREQVGAANN